MSEALEIDEQSTEEVVPQPEQSIDEQIEALIAGEVADAPEMEEEAADTASAEPEGEAEEVEIDYDLKVPLPDEREPVSISELKDRYVESERRESSMQERENAVMRERDELAQVLAQVGEIPPEVQARMREKQQAHLEREHTSMLQAIPEWEDRAVFEKDRTAISELGHNYGFSDDEMSRIADHRLVKLLRDHAKLTEMRADSVKKIEPEKPVRKVKAKKAPPATKKSNVEKLYDTALKTGDKRAGDAAVAAMLGEI